MSPVSQRRRSGVALCLPAALRLSCALPLALSLALPAHAAAPAARDYDIPAQPLAGALRHYMQQSGVQVAYPDEIGDGVTTSAIKGSFGTAEALSRLLSGTGLTFRMTGETTATLERTPHASGNVTLLGPVRVAGDTGSGAPVARLSSDAAATEGTGSYTTRGRVTTANGLSLSAHETPQSITTITRQRMDDQQLLSISDVMTQVPGITMAPSGGERVTFYSRGGAISNYQYDGVTNQADSQTRTIPQTAQDMVLYDRIEVLRGATGLMTGAGDPGGIVNMVRKRPTSELQAHVQGSLGSWNLYRAEGDVSGPLNKAGTIRARVVGMGQRDDSYMANYGHNRAIVYGVAEADVSPTTLLRLGMDYQNYTAHGEPGVPVIYTDGTRTNLPRSASGGATWAFDHSQTYTYSGALEQKLPHDWSLRLAGNLIHVDRNGHVGGYLFTDGLSRLARDGTTTIDRGLYEATQNQRNATATLSGQFSLLGRQHDLAFGYTYNYYRNEHASFGDGGTSAINFFTWGGNIDAGTKGAQTITLNTQYQQSGWFASTRLKPMGALSVILGGRLTNYNYDYYYKYYVTGAVINTQRRQHGQLTPYAGVVLDVTPAHALYVSYTDIFQPQSSQDRNGQTLPPVVGRNYEIGWKGSFAGGRLNGSIAAYQIERDNLAVLDTGYTVPGTTTSAYTTASGTKTKGVDVELMGEVLPRLNLTASYSYGLSKSAAHVQINPQMPINTARLWTTYRLPVGAHDLTLGGGANWNGKSWLYFSRYATTVTQGDYVLVNLMARYAFNDHLSATLNLNNLFDVTYYSSLQAASVYGAPRSVLASVRYTY